MSSATATIAAPTSAAVAAEARHQKQAEQKR
jgi:hypothetical protein